MTRLMKPVERLLYRLFGVDPLKEQNWKQYTIAMLVFSGVERVFTYVILRAAGHLPWHGYVDALSNKTPMTPHLAFNTAVSFMTNTNWQSYGGENTMSYFSQMVALASHNFWSAAAGHRHRRGASPRHRARQIQNHRQLLDRSRPASSLPADADLHGLMRCSWFRRG